MANHEQVLLRQTSHQRFSETNHASPDKVRFLFHTGNRFLAAAFDPCTVSQSVLQFFIGFPLKGTKIHFFQFVYDKDLF